MTEPAEFHRVLNAISFAARAHAGQLRKDGKTPYMSHVFRVAAILRNLFGADDPRLLTAAILHDTIEDTTTDFDDLEAEFGAEVAGWVARLTKEKRLPEDEREARYLAGLQQSPWPVQLCKLADIYDNLLDSIHLPAEKKTHSVARMRRYLDGLDAVGGAETEKARALVRALLNARA
jgi:guanosine-3',5'-bis(diphosphate) 3'-pyrophosphohydrolase